MGQMLPRLVLLAPALLLSAAMSAVNTHTGNLTGKDKSAKAIPGLRTWEANMISLGRKWCDGKKYGFGWEADVWFYDGTRVYYQIADYTHDPSWNSCALNVATHIATMCSRIPERYLDGESSPGDYVWHGSVRATRATSEQ
jgi:hypothetical protein